MKKLLSSFVLILTSILVLSSCSKLSEEQKGKLEGIVSRTVVKYQINDAINEIIIINDGDSAQIARILSCSPSTLKRLAGGITYPTPTFDKEIREVLRIAKLDGASKLQSLDPTDCWYKQFRRYLLDNLVLLLIISVCLGFFGGWVTSRSNNGKGGCLLFATNFIPAFLVLYIYPVYAFIEWVYGWSSTEVATDAFTNVINPALEILTK
ncbi:MAG: hypothetical protein PHI48_07925 [Bacteroidales bacterium]|nr:hypothetical protein [Bacteroidales bacterium]